MKTETVSHTPGPWFLSHWNNVVTGDNFIIADCHRGKFEQPEYKEQTKSNAVLIAAAPELLASLEDALFQLQGYLVAYGNGGPTMKTKLDRYKNIIAKAKGTNS